MYTFNQIAEAVPFRKHSFKIDAALKVRKSFSDKKSYSWNEINEALTNNKWSVKHLLMLRDNLRRGQYKLSR